MEYDPDRNWREIDDAGFNAHIGPLWYSKVDETTSQVALKLDQRHMNMGGVCHGGVYMSSCDTAMGITAFRVMGRVPCATIDFRSHFLAAAKLDQWLIIEARVNRAAGDVVFMECDAWASDRKCFVASGIWKRLKLPQRAAE
jgi:acyl-coenzyme A thioesterase PaaI-like protein